MHNFCANALHPFLIRSQRNNWRNELFRLYVILVEIIFSENAVKAINHQTSKNDE